MLADDPVADRQTQSGPLPRLLRRKERLEHVVNHFRSHTATVVDKFDDQLVRLPAQRDLQRPASFDGVESVGDEVQDHLLDLRTIHVRIAGAGVQKFDLLLAIFGEVLNHRHDLRDGLGQVGLLANCVAAPREIEQSLGDLFAAKRFFLNHPQILQNDLGFGGVEDIQMSENTPLQRFARHGDCRKWIIDLVCDSCSQKTDARQPFRPHELPTALLHLPVQVAGNFLKAAGHFVECVGQFGHLVAGL